MLRFSSHSTLLIISVTWSSLLYYNVKVTKKLQPHNNLLTIFLSSDIVSACSISAFKQELEFVDFTPFVCGVCIGQCVSFFFYFLLLGMHQCLLGPVCPDFCLNKWIWICRRLWKPKCSGDWWGHGLRVWISTILHRQTLMRLVQNQWI